MRSKHAFIAFGGLVVLFLIAVISWRHHRQLRPSNPLTQRIQELRGMASEIRADLHAVRDSLDKSMDSDVERLEGLLSQFEKQLKNHSYSIETFAEGLSRIDQIENNLGEVDKTIKNISDEIARLKERAQNSQQIITVDATASSDPGIVSALNSISSKVQALDKQWSDLRKNDTYVFQGQVCVQNSCLTEKNLADLINVIPKVNALDSSVATASQAATEATIKIDRILNAPATSSSPAVEAAKLDELVSNDQKHSARLDVVQANINDMLSTAERNSATLTVVQGTLDDVLARQDKKEADLNVLKSQLAGIETDVQKATNLKTDMSSELKKETEALLDASLPAKLIDLQQKVQEAVKRDAETLVNNQIKAVNDRLALVRSFDPNNRVVMQGPFRTAENHRCFDQASDAVDSMAKLSWGCPANTYVNGTTFRTTEINCRQERVCRGVRGQVCTMERRCDTGYLVNFKCCKFDKD